MKAMKFERFAGYSTALAGLTTFLYAVTYFGIERTYSATGFWLSNLFLMLTGALLTPLFVGLYARLRETDGGYGLLAFLLGFFGAIATMVRGGYGLAVAAAGQSAAGNLIAVADPRGILSFGLLGISFFMVSWLIVAGGQFPRGISYLGYLVSIDLVYLFLARLIIINSTYLSVSVPMLVLDFILLPAWFFWLGADLIRGLVDERFKGEKKSPDLYCCSV